ncbi:MAG: DTW domain-containing protein [Cyanobacteriota bacterium]
MNETEKELFEKRNQNKLNKKDSTKAWRGYKVIRCEECQLPEITCICGREPEIISNVTFCIIMNEREPKKPTNTGRLIEDTMKKTKVFIWSRVNENKELIDLINNDLYDPYVIFPDDTEELKSKVVDFQKKEKKEPLFIILDGTWKQARRIFNKSEYLKKLPILSIKIDKTSEYQLRRASDAHHLCTVEVGIELLKIAGESKQSEQLYDYFCTFIKHYLAGRSNHKIEKKELS